MSTSCLQKVFLPQFLVYYKFSYNITRQWKLKTSYSISQALPGIHPSLALLTSSRDRYKIEKPKAKKTQLGKKKKRHSLAQKLGGYHLYRNRVELLNVMGRLQPDRPWVASVQNPWSRRAQVPNGKDTRSRDFQKGVHLGRERTQKQCTVKDGAKPHPIPWLCLQYSLDIVGAEASQVSPSPAGT